MQFEDMDIDTDVLASLDRIGFREPTRIQIETIPLIKEGYDVVGQSETGSGKTAAFGIPLAEKVRRGIRTQALILAPTRELAQQIARELSRFSHAKGVRVECIYGGAAMAPQVSGLRKAEIVVGTPGRVMDHMRRGTLDTGNIETFILDEADRMIDMGFIDDIREIERAIPKERQTIMFSATMPESLYAIRDGFTRGAKKVTTETRVSENLLKQYYCDVDRHLKFSLLVHLLNEEDPELAIVFCNSRRDADSVARNLRLNGIDAEALHGGLSQPRREHIVRLFHRQEIRVLVATDIAARGLDFKRVTHIFNYSVPKNAEDYVNRIGRTARAGEAGKSVVLLSEEDYDSFRRISRTCRFIIPQMECPRVKVLPFKRERYGDRDGGRGHHWNRKFERRATGFVRRPEAAWG